MLTITARVADRTPIYIKGTSESGTSRKYVFGWPAARSKAAWWIVHDRYGQRDINGDNQRPRQWPERYDCDCYDEDGDRWGDCEIHGKHGYLRRLHDRVVRWLAAGYMLPDSGLKEE